MTQRSHAFDLLCGICIVRMVMGHVTNACSFGKMEWWTELFQWTFFFMCFFFFKAGYFNKTIVGNTREFLVDKTRRLLVPYFAWGTIANVIYFSFVFFVFPPNHTALKTLQIEHIWMNGGFYGNPPLWFLFSFYLTYVVAHFLNKIPSRPLFRTRWGEVRLSAVWLVLVFPYVSSLLSLDKVEVFMSLGNVFMGVFIFETGRLWRKFVDANSRRTVISLSVVLLATFVVLNASFSYEYSMYNNMWDGTWYGITASILCAICGLSGILLSIDLPRIPALGFVGEHSMVYFVSHYVVILLYRFTRSAFGHTINKQWDDFLIMLPVCFIICTMLVSVVERTPLLSGRYKKKKLRLWII